MNSIHYFVDAISKADNIQDFKAALATITDDMGFKYYSLIHQASFSAMEPNEVIVLCDYPPEWIDQYRKKKFYDIDPVIAASRRRAAGFEWDELHRLIKLTDSQKRFMQLALAEGIGNGFTVPAHVPGTATGTCSFALSPGKALPRHSFPIAQYVGSLALDAVHVLKSRQPNARLQPHLTTRQLECVILFGQGASDKEIARHLGISDETVREHFVEARRRYGGCKRRQLLIFALLDGHMNLLDLLHPSDIGRAKSLHASA